MSRALARDSTDSDAVRFAIVGLGHIAQVAVLPAFAHADGAELRAFVSSDRTKRAQLGRRWGVRQVFDYDQYDEMLRSGIIDAVYITLPNHLHREYALRAAEAGVHVLVEKPMAVTEAECHEMIEAAEAGGVQLMVAYRLHFEAANLEAVEVAQSGRLGELRLFESLFTQVVKPGDIRLGPIARGGGSVYDMGVYCINAARYLFRSEPVEAVAVTVRGADPRYTLADESTSVVLRFPGDRLASFTTSFGTADVSTYRLLGTRGELAMERAYKYTGPMAYTLSVDGQSERREHPSRDQFGPQLDYFAACVREGRRPEPDGTEGLADVRIIEAVLAAAERRRPVTIEPVARYARPGIEQESSRPPVEQQEEIHASGPSP